MRFKYNAGDKVVIKSFRTGFMDEKMTKYLSQVVTITGTREVKLPGFKQSFYRIEEDNGRYNWGEDMIERLYSEVEEDIREEDGIKSVDIVKAWGLDFYLGNAITHIEKINESKNKKEEIMTAISYLEQKLFDILEIV